MSLVQALLPALDAVKAIAGPEILDIRPFRIIVRVRTWSSGVVQKGTPTDVDRELWPRPDVVKQGRDLFVREVTPKYATGGYAPADLNPHDMPGVEFYYVAIGPDGVSRPYALVAIDTSDPFDYKLKVTSLDRKVPF